MGQGQRFTIEFEDGSIKVRPLGFPPVTLDKLKSSDRPNFHFNTACGLAFGPKGGIYRHLEAWRANGALKTWKTRPKDFRLPLKHGTHAYGELTPTWADSYHFEDECPLALLPNNREDLEKLIQESGQNPPHRGPKFILTLEPGAKPATAPVGKQPVVLRWLADDGTQQDTSCVYDPTETALSFSDFLDTMIQSHEDLLHPDRTFVGHVVGREVRTSLDRSDYVLLHYEPSGGLAILRHVISGSSRELWAKLDPESFLYTQPPRNLPGVRPGEVYVIETGLAEVGPDLIFMRHLGLAEAEKLSRRWRGISPDEDGDLDVPDGQVGRDVGPAIPGEHEVSAPSEQTEVEPIPDRENLARQVAAEVNMLYEEAKETFDMVAQSRIDAMNRAAGVGTLPVPEMHNESQFTEVMRFDPESGEYRMTHAYHDLYAHPERGEVVTQKMSLEDNAKMAQILANLVKAGTLFQPMLTTVTSVCSTGQIFDWESIGSTVAREIGSSVNHLVAEKWTESLKFAHTVTDIMLQEQRGEVHHQWALSWPTIHLASVPDDPRISEQYPLVAFCGTPSSEDGTFKWIHPKRFRQVGPVSFGTMCERCVAELDKWEEENGPVLSYPEEVSEAVLARAPYKSLGPVVFGGSVGRVLGTLAKDDNTAQQIADAVSTMVAGRSVDWRLAETTAFEIAPNEKWPALAEAFHLLGHGVSVESLKQIEASDNLTESVQAQTTNSNEEAVTNDAEEGNTLEGREREER